MWQYSVNTLALMKYIWIANMNKMEITAAKVESTQTNVPMCGKHTGNSDSMLATQWQNIFHII